MCGEFTMEVDDSEIIVGNGRVDLSQKKWMQAVNEIRRLRARVEELEKKRFHTGKQIFEHFNVGMPPDIAKAVDEEFWDLV